MELWRETQSILAPLIVSIRLGDDGVSACMNALIAAAACVPEATCLYNVKKSGKLRRQSEIRRRLVVTATGEQAAPYFVRAHLLDVPVGMAPGAASQQWEVGLRVLKAGSAAPAFPGDVQAAFLETSAFRLGSEGLTGAPQLALLRHLWVSTLQSLDPSAIVVGGQDSWEDRWWTESISSDEIGAST